MINKENKILTTSSNQGHKLNIASGKYRIIISGKQTNGSFAVIEMSVPPGAGPVPHSHPNSEESFYVLEGEISFKSETGAYIAKNGSFVSIPKGGIIHNFRNLTERPAKLLCTVIPAGLDEYFEEVADFMESIKDKPAFSTFEMKDNMSRISEKYGQKLYNPDYLDL
jgi:quercetin dioxygenase-like cupin family protein